MTIPDYKLTPVEKGDNIDLEIEAKYPCSDGSEVWTISVDKVADKASKIALKYAVEKVKYFFSTEWTECGDGIATYKRERVDDFIKSLKAGEMP